MGARTDKEIIVTIRRDTVDVQAGTRAKKTVPLALDSTRRETIDLLRDQLSRKDRVTLDLIRVLGRQLFDTIFHEEALDELARAFRDTGAQRLRIQLCFDDSGKELAEYPWEFMYWKRTSAPSFFLATQMSLALCRYMELDDDRPDLELPEGQLRVLLVVSRPDPELSKLHPVDETAICEALETVRAALAERDPPIELSLAKLDKPTRDALGEAVQRTRPHVIHFMGHGRFQTGRGEIALLKADELSVHWCTDEIFAQYVAPKGAEVPLLIVLHMCEGAVVDFEQSFRGMAPQLVLNRVPAVVAMQYSIPDIDAQTFSIEFYRRLGEGLPIDAAVQMARFQIYSQEDNRNPRGFGTPVLYLHSIDGVIKPSAPPAAGGAAQRSPAASHVQSNAPEDQRAPNGAPSPKVDPGPPPQSFDQLPCEPAQSQVSVRLTNQIINKLWAAVSAECEVKKYDLKEVSAEVVKMIKSGSELRQLAEIRAAIGERISNGPSERFYSVYVRMDESLPERTP